MSYLDPKEQVIDLKLTSYGKYLLAIGKLKPTFYAFFDDGLDIQYEPRKTIFNPQKRTLWIGADPDKVDIAFFHSKFKLNPDDENETGVWLSVHDDELYYHGDAISEISSELDRGS